MFTVLNLLNYSIGKPINTFILILITMGIYFGLIKYYYDIIHDNTIYTITLLILMLIDIISVILIYFYFSDSKSDNSNIIKIQNVHDQEFNKEFNKELNKESNKKKEKTDKKDKKEKKDKLKNQEKIVEKKNQDNLPTQTFITNNDEKELISLFDINKDPSIVTYK